MFQVRRFTGSTSEHDVPTSSSRSDYLNKVLERAKLRAKRAHLEADSSTARVTSVGTSASAVTSATLSGSSDKSASPEVDGSGDRKRRVKDSIFRSTESEGQSETSLKRRRRSRPGADSHHQGCEDLPVATHEKPEGSETVRVKASGPAPKGEGLALRIWSKVAQITTPTARES